MLILVHTLVQTWWRVSRMRGLRGARSRRRVRRMDGGAVAGYGRLDKALMATRARSKPFSATYPHGKGIVNSPLFAQSASISENFHKEWLRNLPEFPQRMALNFPKNGSKNGSNAR